MKYFQFLVYLIILITSYTANASPYISYNWKIANQNCMNQAEKAMNAIFQPLIVKKSFIVGSYSEYKGMILCVKNIMLFVVSGKNFAITQQLTNKLKKPFIGGKIIQNNPIIKSPDIAFNWTALNINSCVKQANKSMNNLAFQSIINKNSFIVGSKNNYKGIISCVNKQAFFIVSGENFTIASNLANKLRNNFISTTSSISKIKPIIHTVKPKITSTSSIKSAKKSIKWLVKNYNTSIFPALSYLPATKKIVHNIVDINLMSYEKLTQSLSLSQKQQIITSVNTQLNTLAKIDSQQILQQLYQWVVAADQLLKIKQDINLKQFIWEFYQSSATKSCFDYLQGIGINNSMEFMSIAEMNTIQYCAFNKLAAIPKSEFNKQLSNIIDKFDKFDRK